VDQRVTGNVIRLEPQLVAVAFQLDAVKAIYALHTEVSGLVGKNATAIPPVFMVAGFFHHRLSWQKGPQPVIV
jgi:hypothetical protein